MDADTVYEVIKRLTGSIYPIGETNADNKRYENLKVLLDVIDTLLKDIDNVVYNNCNAHQYSIKRSVDEVEKWQDRQGITE